MVGVAMLKNEDKNMNDNFQKAYETQLQHSNEWLQAVRAQNFKKFLAQGFPTKHLEEWKYTDVTSINQQHYQLTTKHGEITPDLLKHYLPNSHTVIFNNGHYLKQIAHDLPTGVILTNLREGLAHYPEKIKPYLEKQASQAFELLNLSLLQDGIFLYIPKKISLQKPIQLIFFSTNAAGNSMQHLRNLMLIEEQAAVNVVESYIGTEQNYFNNVVTEIFAKENSQVSYFKNQNEASQATHISKIAITQQANSRVKTYSFSFGSKLAREDLHIALQGKGAECALYGLYLTNNQQQIDHHTRVDHLVPQGSSYELYKGITADKSQAVFNGKIIVHRDAQQTRTQQINQNILLTKTAAVNAKPELEIYADNVQCTHGATVGQIDEQALFYLRSRGIDIKKAAQVLTFAFASEVTDNIPLSSIKDYINNYLREKLKNSGESSL